MLQLATQSTQVLLNSRPVDNRRLPSSTCAVLHTPQKLFRACLAVTVAVRNLDDRQLWRLTGAGYMIVNETSYMIVNELVLTRAGLARGHRKILCCLYKLGSSSGGRLVPRIATPTA